MSTYVFLQHIVRSLARSEIVRIDLFWTGLTGYCQSPGSVCSASKPPQGDVWTPIQNTRQTRYKIDILHIYSGLEQIECGLYCRNDGGEDLLLAVFAFAHPWSPSLQAFWAHFFFSRNNNKGVHFYHCCTFSLDLCCYIFLISYVHVMLGFLRQTDIWTFEIHFWNLNCLLQFWLKLWRLRNRTQIVLLNPENNKIYFNSISPTFWSWRNMSQAIVYPIEQ